MADERYEELLAKLIRIETQLDMMLTQFAEIHPRVVSLEKETERQKDSLKQAHKRIDAQDKRYYWIVGIIIAIVTSLFAKFAA